MARRLYPIGIQTFERIRQENKMYVDKTAYVYRMTHSSGKYLFLNRPRRFGKSLLVSTLESYFEGRKDLFGGLAIDRMETEWTSYPVIHLDMSGGKHSDEAQLKGYLDFILRENERKYGVTCDEQEPNTRLNSLINALYEKTGRQVVVLIDE